VAHLALVKKEKSLSTSSTYEARFYKNICEIDGKRTRRFCLFKEKIFKISEAKMKEGIFVGPQIKQLFEDQDFSTKLNATDIRTWEAFENV
jgi:hypothetical protein